SGEGYSGGTPSAPGLNDAGHFSPRRDPDDASASVIGGQDVAAVIDRQAHHLAEPAFEEAGEEGGFEEAAAPGDRPDFPGRGHLADGNLVGEVEDASGADREGADRTQARAGPGAVGVAIGSSGEELRLSVRRPAMDFRDVLPIVVDPEVVARPVRRDG